MSVVDGLPEETAGDGRAFQPQHGLAVQFKIYEPFSRPQPDGFRSLVIYALRSDGSRRRIGSLEAPGPDAEAFLQFWREAGASIATREELGLPPSIKAARVVINPA